MKKVIAILLALCLLLSLAACGEPAATTGKQEPAATTENRDPVPTTTAQPTPTTTAQPTPTTTAQPVPTTTVTPTTVPDVPETVDLVTAYENGTGSLVNNQVIGGYRMDFVYASDYRSGTVTLTLPYEVVEGTFTCDENYNICNMEFREEAATVVFEIAFDDARRVVSAKSCVVEGENTDLRYEAEYGYDDQGRTIYSKRVAPGEMTITTYTQYNEAGQTISQSNYTEYYMSEEVQSSTFITTFEFDENGYMLGISYDDGTGEWMQRMPATYEIIGEEVWYTLEADGVKMVLVMNKEGKTVLQEQYVGGELMSRAETEYDEAGRAMKLTQWMAYNNATVVIEFAYTADGRRCLYTETADGEVLVIERTTFQTVEIPE